MIRRFLAAILLVWVAGFAWFTIALPGPAPIGSSGTKTDAVVVPTGGAGRIQRGLEVLGSDRSGQLLVSGVDPEVKSDEFAAQFDVPMRMMECCVTLGQAAVDTRSNAAETAAWIEGRGYRSVRLVTTDWHMWRAAGELRHALPDEINIVEDATRSEPSLRILFLEYHKLLASRLSRLRQNWDGSEKA